VRVGCVCGVRVGGVFGVAVGRGDRMHVGCLLDAYGMCVQAV